MPHCRSCGAELSAGSRYCSRCGAAAGTPAEPNLTATSPSSPQERSTHAPFEPGTRLGRYRIVAFLGRGGMGEVYRADDLELNQAVALKFLPGRVEANSLELDQLRREVRVAREIAHPNVCRTYDIASVDGHAFLVMEFIGGEDLASALRRMGRPSSDKAVEIAQQICLGLGAAHERGILHRDLKPANVMIDDHGRVRITDFGLAGLEAELTTDGGGTPAYMAPEQLSGGSASIQSDLYSLGLVLYEVFTGKRAYESRTAKRPADSTPRPPSTLTPDIDPAVERVVMRCLEPDPKLRPASAYAVLGALPGGDPLAAALAAGETPSPELVASATVEGSLRPAVAIACVVLAVASLLGLAAVDRKEFTGFHRSATELALRSSELLAEAGIAKPAYSYGGFMENSIFVTRVEERDSSALALHAAHPERATGILYWRRWSPVALKHPDMHNPSPNLFEPVPGPGGVMELLDMDGRLVHLSSMPTASGEPAGPKPTTTRRANNWPDLVSAAGYDATRTVTANTTAATTTAANTTAANTTAANATLGGADSVTTSTVPGQGAGDAPVTLHASWRNGGVDRFWIDAPWGTSRDPFALAAPSEDRWFTLIFFTLIPLLGSVLFAIRNLKAGRGDRRGAWRLALFTFLAYFTAHALFLNWSEMGLANAMEFMLRQAPMGHALLHGVTVWLLYMALEPYIRRLWPRVLVSWARLMSGRPRDPMIGRDILVGFMFVAFNTAVTLATLSLRRPAGAVRTFFGLLDSLSGTGPTLAGMANFAAGGTQIVMAFFTILLIARILLRRNWAAIAFAFVFFGTLYYVQGARSNGPLVTVIGTLCGLCAFAFVALRFGFLAALISAFLSQVADQIPWTTDLSAWYASRMLIAVAVFGALMVYGFFTALGGRSIFRDPIGETG